MKRGRSRYESDDSDQDDSRSDDRAPKKSANTETEKRVPIPDDTDMNFLMQLFDKTVSKYIDTLFEETGVRAQLIAMPRGGKHHFMLRGNAAKLTGAARAIEKLLDLSGRERAMLLQSSYIGDAPLLEEADPDPILTMSGIEPKIQTSRMDFTKLSQTVENPKETVKVPPEMVRYVCTAKKQESAPGVYRSRGGVYWSINYGLWYKNTETESTASPKACRNPLHMGRFRSQSRVSFEPKKDNVGHVQTITNVKFIQI